LHLLEDKVVELNSTKIHTLVDAFGNPIGFFLTGGEAHDLVGVDHLLPTMAADTLIADKTFDADERVLEPLAAAGKTAVVPPRTNGPRRATTIDSFMARAICSRTSSPRSSSFVRSPPATRRPRATSLPPSSSSLTSFGSIDDWP
jgi:transposase